MISHINDENIVSIGPSVRNLPISLTTPPITGSKNSAIPFNIGANSSNSSITGPTIGSINALNAGIATSTKYSLIGPKIGVIASPKNAPILSPINPPTKLPTKGANGPKIGVKNAVSAILPTVAPIPPPTAFCTVSPAANLLVVDTTPAVSDIAIGLVAKAFAPLNPLVANFLVP